MTIDVGVIGVGSMGKHHVRVYRDLRDANLVGIYDDDEERAKEVAREHDTEVVGREDLIALTDAVSVAVPTEYHHDVAEESIKSGVHVLVEKPFVEDVEAGEELVELADEKDVRLQVGHIERFNPAVMAVKDYLSDLNVIALEARRLGPDPGRDIQDTVVTDLMIHDLDIVRYLLGDEPSEVQATGTRAGKHASATLSFNDGKMATLSASRVTQKKIRQLTVAAEECYVEVDYLNKDVGIHRDSVPEYVAQEDGVRYRHESVIERPVVENKEPLKNELEAFLRAVRKDEIPQVTGEDGLEAVKLSQAVEKSAFSEGD